jgi:hypothetical protein
MGGVGVRVGRWIKAWSHTWAGFQPHSLTGL